MSNSTAQRTYSQADSFRILPPKIRKDRLDKLTAQESLALLYDWPFWARPNQIAPPGDWFGWLIMAGRGFGKTRTGAEWVRGIAESKLYGHIAIVAKDPGEARDVMIEGDSGILRISPPWQRPVYKTSLKRLTWPNGAIGSVYSSEDFDELRGPQHDAAWVDELAKYRYVKQTWDNLLFGLRIGKNPRVCITTTPRPIHVMKELVGDPTVIKTTGTTYENRTNLSPVFYAKIIARYEGTRLGRQELNAELLSDIPGQLWTLDRLDKNRIPAPQFHREEMARIVIAIDPAASANEGSDETGIVAAGRGLDGHGYMIADESGQYSPQEWASRAIRLYRTWQADGIVYEANMGGDMVAHVLHSVDATVPVKAVHATRGKHVRAEPISTLDEQGKVHNVGAFPELEDQLVAFTSDGYTGEGSPDRADAYVWAFTDLMIGQAEWDDSDIGVGESAASQGDW